MTSQNPGGGGGSSDGDYGWGPPAQQQHAQYTPIRNAHQAHHHGHGQSPAQPGVPDMPVVLLALADTYITAAHANGYRVSFGTASDTEAYYKLVATGLACLETALQYRLQPRVEAIVRLRYASILYEETDNLDEAEEALNKGLQLTTRNNLMELKCSMQYLLVKITSKTNHKAALRMLNLFIQDVETLDIPLWTYSFRFLRFHLLAEMGPTRDDQAATNALRSIYTMSKERMDVQVLALASLMEAMVSLRNGADGVDNAQRGLSRVFTQQNGGLDIPPQLEVLTQLLDICCSLLLSRTQECDPKLRKLHATLDQPARWLSWKEDGEFSIDVNPVRPGRPPEGLKVKWLNKDDVFAVGYFLSGLVKFQKNVEENGKAERFLTEGLKTIDRITAGFIQTSLEESKSKFAWKRSLKSYMYLYYAFLLCMRTDWDLALKIFRQLEEVVVPLNLLPNSALALQITYLRAVISHGTNNLYQAVQSYTEVVCNSPPDAELSIISKLNQILILRPQNPSEADALLASVERFCPQHKNELLKAAYITIKATARGELVKTKNYLSLALRHAAAAGNVQLTFIVLNFMCHRFFSGVVSEQAEKSAKAAWQNAKRGRDTLWTLMGGQMYADCLARKGNDHEAMRQQQMNEEARLQVVKNLTRNLPPPLPYQEVEQLDEELDDAAMYAMKVMHQ